MKGTIMTHYFDINTEDVKVRSLLDKYSYCIDQYATNYDESKAFGILSQLDDYEKIIFIAFVEYKTCRSVADLFHTNMNYASKAIKDVRSKVSSII